MPVSQPPAVCMLMAVLLALSLADFSHLQQDTDPDPFRPERDIYPGPSSVKLDISPDGFRLKRDISPDPGFPQQDVYTASRRALVTNPLLMGQGPFMPQPVPAQTIVNGVPQPVPMQTIVNGVPQQVLPQVPIVNGVPQTLLPARVPVVNGVAQSVLPAPVQVINGVPQPGIPTQVMPVPGTPMVNTVAQIPGAYGVNPNLYYQIQNQAVPDVVNTVLAETQKLKAMVTEEAKRVKQSEDAVAQEGEVLKDVDKKVTELQKLVKEKGNSKTGGDISAEIASIKQDLERQKVQLDMESKMNKMSNKVDMAIAEMKATGQNAGRNTRRKPSDRAGQKPTAPSILTSDFRRSVTEQEQQTNSSSQKMNSTKAQSPENPGGPGNTQDLSKPAFSVKYEAGQGSLETGDQGAVRFSQVVTNVGSGYNATTGHFTAPLAGQYAFFLSVHATNDTASLGLYRSANHTAPLFPVSGSRDSGFVTTTLTKGEDVYVRESSNGSLAAVSYASFSGHLI